MAKKKQFDWQDKVGNPAQIGGIETSVLDNGLGKGTRIAWVSTGSGLRYKVVIDRALDIVDAFSNQHSLAWLSHAGVTAPRPDATTGIEWLWSFGGGLLTTCGLTHAGGPENDEFGQRGLHGRISNLPAEVESIVQPDLRTGKLDMSITAVTKQSRVFGPNLELRRTISSTLGEATIRIHDVVTNVSNTTTPHMLLYHCNYGWPLVDAGTQILWRGSCQSRGMEMDNAIFNDKHDFRTCRKPMESHRGTGEACGFIDVTPDKNGMCTIGLHNPKLGLAVATRYKKKQLPCLANWQHWGPGEYVTGLEPATNPPTGQGTARAQKKLIHLRPGRSRTYDLEISVLTDTKAIQQFLKARVDTMSSHIFAGFGFGPIQAGLFAEEAFESGHFCRIVVAEIAQPLVDAVRANGGTYFVNVAQTDGIETLKIDNVELLNPTRPEDNTIFRISLAEATEIVTSLPSVDFYRAGQASSVAALIAEAVRTGKAKGTIVYAAENNNHAAEILQQAVAQEFATDSRAGTHDLSGVQFLNTVIGKMSRVVTDAQEIAELNLTPIAPGIDRAFLVEAFNHILATKTTIPGFTPGIGVFVEKDDLLPFEEAKLYGHNAIHALLGFIGAVKGYGKMTELQSDRALMHIARDAFLNESGGALIAKYATLGDDLFSAAGYRHFADDLLDRMTNPYLADTTARAGRDTLRKLGAGDRIFGTMALALEHDISPKNMALGALAGVAIVLGNADEYEVPAERRAENWHDLNRGDLSRLLRWIWKGEKPPFQEELIDLTFEARKPLAELAPR